MLNNYILSALLCSTWSFNATISASAVSIRGQFAVHLRRSASGTQQEACGHKVLSVSLPSHERCSTIIFPSADEIQFFWMSGRSLSYRDGFSSNRPFFFFLNPDGSSEGKARAFKENLIKTMSATSPQHGLAEPVVMQRY